MAHVRQLDHDREAFYARCWSGKKLTPESFTVTLNTAQLGERQMVGAIVAILPDGQLQRSSLSPSHVVEYV